MDWQTKEDIDSQFSELNDKLDSIMRHFNIEADEDLDDESETEEEPSEELQL